MIIKVIFLRGIPASGKSTWKNEFLKSDSNFRVVSRDSIRYAITGEEYKYTNANEKIVTSMEYSLIEQFVFAGNDIIIDATNLDPKYLDGYFLEFAKIKSKSHSTDFEFLYKEFDIDLETAKQRNSNRVGIACVPDSVMDKMYRTFVTKSHQWKNRFKHLVLNYESFFESFQIVQNKSLPKAVIFDLDGTFCINKGRSPYDGERVGEDGLNEAVFNLYNLLGTPEQLGDVYTIICTGREDTGNCEANTKKWLETNNIHYDEFYIRKQGDHRADWVVKKEFLNDIVKHYYVLFAVDDRTQVVENCWRRSGIPCFQVQSNNF